jgi:hypothetical protein
MKVVNDGLPKAIFDAIANDPYSAGSAWITATRLIDAPRIRQLMLRHGEGLTEPASGRLWSLFGQAMHHVIERAYHPDALKEERLEMEVEGKTVSGKFDFYADGVLSDFKIAKAYSYVFGKGKAKLEWVAQLNVLAELARVAGLEVKRLTNIVMYRDHDERKAEKTRDYPPPTVELEVPLWDRAETQAYITRRVQLHAAAEPLDDDHLPACTATEMWEKPPEFAVKVPGSAKAYRVFDTAREAEECITMSGGGKYVLELRPGERTRCLHYCAVRSVCNLAPRATA